MRHALHRLLPENLRMGRHLAPSQKGKTFLLHNDLEHLLCLVFAQLILRKEKHANAVLSLPPKLDSQTFRHLLKEFVRNLGQNSHAVSRLALRILPCPVLQILHNPQSVLHGLAALFSFNIHTGSDTAVVMFKFRTVKRRPWNCQPCIKHTFSPSPARRAARMLRQQPAHRKSRKRAFLPLLCDLQI